jgi:excisionase family DNA binding protein
VVPRARGKSGNSQGAEHGQSTALLTLQAVATHCACSIWTVRSWVDAGKLPVVRLPGRLIRVRPADLEHLISGGWTA